MTFAEYTKKKKEKEKQKTETPAQGKSFKEYTEEVLGVKIDEDIGPVKETEEQQSSRFSVFKAGALEDGYQFGDILRTSVATAMDAKNSMKQGFTNMGEGVVDLILHGVSGAANLVGADSFADAVKETANRNYVDEAFDFHRDSSLFGNYGENSLLDDFGRKAAQGIGQAVTTIGTAGLGAAAGLGKAGTTALTMGTTFASSAGSGISEAYNEKEGISGKKAFAYGTMKGAIDAGTELLSGGLGKAVSALGISRGIGGLDDMFAKKLSGKLSNYVVRNAAQYGVKAAGEGLEEVIAEVGTAAAKKLTYMSDAELKDLVSKEDLLESFVLGTFTGAVMQGGDLAQSLKNKTDFVTGMTENEQKVFDKVYEDAIAEREADGTKLTQKEKNSFYESTLTAMEKGYIDTDTIESVLGGESYNSYKSLTEQENKLKQEIESLENLPKEQITVKQSERLTKARKELEALDITDAKNRLNHEVSEMARADRLGESYNERDRRSKRYEANLESYDEKQRVIVQKAMDSGILNNTNRTHEFVDMIAKISADKGVLFDFTDNKKLKESGFALEGKTVNGFLKDGNISLNINSAKALNVVVGHEITHVLEGTELYGELQQVVKAYAESKGEYGQRLEVLQKLYEGVEGTNIENELTADLIGDYLFTDSEFVNRLSAEQPGLFKKIFEEIKYLVKAATVGSKQARELEEVKRTFEKAYRENGATTNADGKIKYSINSKFYEQLDNWDGETIGFSFVVGETSEALQKAGIPRKQIRWDASKITTLLKKHSGMTRETVKGIPELLENPVIVIDSKKGDNSKIVMGELYDENGKIVTAVLLLTPTSKKGNVLDLVKISSAEGRSHISSLFMKEDGTPVTVRYVDRKRIQNWLNVNRLQLPLHNHIMDSNNIIPQNEKNASEAVKNSLGEDIAPIGGYKVRGEDIELGPVRSDIAPVQQSQVMEDIGPVREDIASENQKNSDGNTKIKDVTQDIMSSYGENPKSQFLRTSSTNSVSQNEENASEDTGVALDEEVFSEEAEKPQIITRSALHSDIIQHIKDTFSEEGLDFDNVLKGAKNLSSFATVDNTPQRVMEKALGYKEGQVLSDLTVNKIAQNETEGIKWLNSFTNRRSGLLAQISKQYHIKPGSKESAAAQMYAEGFYVNDRNEIIKYGDAELAKDFPDWKVQNNIKGLAKDKRIRQIYDETLRMINESRIRNAYPEIPRLDNYFLHFRAMDDTFSRLGLPFNPNDIRAKDLPTDLNGVTADLKPGQPYFASAMRRTGKRTSFDLLGGLERYLTSAKNQIYHIDDIQTLRALRNYIADTYGQAHGLENLDTLTEEEAQEKIKEVYGSHLSTFARFLNEEANVLAGKTALIDRGLEGIIGRRGITFLDTVNRQTGSNMVGFSGSSAIVNFDAIPRAAAKMNKADFVKGFAQFTANKIGSVFGRNDGFAEQSPVMIRRNGAERFYRTPWQKVGDSGYVLMGIVDNISTEIIARAKYNECIRKGMEPQKAHFETDKWVSRLMGDRSLGQQPQLFNSKMLGLITKFQLEVRNNLDSTFYDTIQEAKVSNEEIQNGLARNAKTAAKVTSTFVQLAVAQHLFGKAFESVAGYNPAFDIIAAILKTVGYNDDEESEDTVLDNLEQGFLELLGDLPYTSTLTGGRIPVASALPIEQFVTGKDDYGNDKSRWETMKETVPYYVLPTGYGQIKKTVQGLGIFDDDLPIAGSYTNSGKLRFAVEDTVANRIQAGVFGQWASKTAREYFEDGRTALNEKQTQELIDSGMSMQEYWEYRDGLKGLSTLGEKAEYINSLDVPIETKNLLINNLSERKEAIDMSDYDAFEDFEEFDFAIKNPEKYEFLQKNGISYNDYKNADEKGKNAYTWASKNPGGYAVSRVVTEDVVEYRKYVSELNQLTADKDENGKPINGSVKAKTVEYINNLPLNYGQRMILFKSVYPGDDTYNYEIVEYLNGQENLTYGDIAEILTELEFTVQQDGTVTW